MASRGCRYIYNLKLAYPCHSNFGFSNDFAKISNSRRFKRHKYFDPFILRTDPFPVHHNIQQMYSKDGFVTRRLFTVLQMYVANYVTTCHHTDGNISSPAGAPTKTRRCLAAVVTGFGDRASGMVWPVFPFADSKL